jgi:HKD family nuclease
MTETSMLDEVIQNKEKIGQFVIGIDFVQTSPMALAKVQGIDGVRVATGNSGRTFHPKVYLFKSGVQYAAIVGSSNFTTGGLKSNDESSLFIEGGDDGVFSSIEKSVSAWWETSSEITDEFLSAYTLRWNASKSSREELAREFKIYAPKSDALHPDFQTMTWFEFVDNLSNAKNPNIEGRLGVIRKARELFNSTLSFHEMDILERKAIAGYIGKQEIQRSALKGYDWGWFGSMAGAGVFKNRVNEGDRYLSLALEAIPLCGSIYEEDYLRFVSNFERAFKNSERVGGVPTASRLLAMKRPDYFICVDKKNRAGLSRDLGFSMANLSLDNYWENVIQPIIQSNWWNEKRPEGNGGKIWDARVAMLDVIYYDWD